MQSGASERKLTAFAAQDFVCGDAAANFPDAAEDFRLLALEANRCLAVGNRRRRDRSAKQSRRPRTR